MNMKSTMCWLTCTNKCSYLNTRRPINYFGRWVLAARAKAVSKRYPEVNQWKHFTNRSNQSNRSKELPFQNSGNFPLGSRRALLDTVCRLRTIFHDQKRCTHALLFVLTEPRSSSPKILLFSGSLACCNAICVTCTVYSMHSTRYSNRDFMCCSPYLFYLFQWEDKTDFEFQSRGRSLV